MGEGGGIILKLKAFIIRGESWLTILISSALVIPLEVNGWGAAQRYNLSGKLLCPTFILFPLFCSYALVLLEDKNQSWLISSKLVCLKQLTSKATTIRFKTAG